MRATKCDRCGKYYIEEEDDNYSSYIGIIKRNIDTMLNKSADLCPDCTKALDDFMKGVKTVNE